MRAEFRIKVSLKFWGLLVGESLSLWVCWL